MHYVLMLKGTAYPFDTYLEYLRDFVRQIIG